MQLKLLLNGDTLDHYLSHLESSGYSSSAQHAKLCRLQVGVEYIKIEGSVAEVVEFLYSKCSAGILESS